LKGRLPYGISLLRFKIGYCRDGPAFSGKGLLIKGRTQSQFWRGKTMGAEERITIAKNPEKFIEITIAKFAE
jgi:hypothetical protein